MLSTFIAIRHIKTHFIKYFISALGLALGVIVLTVSLAISNGLDQNMIDGILSLNSHLKLSKKDSYIYNYKDIINDSENIPKFLAIYPKISEITMIEHSNYTTIVTTYGNSATFFSNLNLVEGELPNSLTEGLIGTELRRILNIDVGDQLTLTTATGKKIKIKISGFFSTSYYEYDSASVLLPLTTAQIIFETSDSVERIEYRIINIKETEDLRKKLTKMYPSFEISTWKEQNSSLLQALIIEKRLAMSIFSLLIVISIFSSYVIISNLVKEKTKDIGILKAIGIPKDSILKIFFLQGILILSSGLIIGIFSSIYIINYLKENSFDFISSIYYIDKIPTRISIYEFLLIICGTIVLVVVSSLLPAYKSAKLNPTEAIKDE